VLEQKMEADIDPSLTGAAFDLANAGYTPMEDPVEKDEETIGSDNVSLREAAEQRSATPDPVIVREYRDDEGKPVAADEAITLARAARDYAGIAAAEKLISENESSEALAKRIDALRSAALAEDPDAAEFYGFKPPKDKEAGKAEAADGPANATGELSSGKLAPELEKALQHPQVVQAIEERINEAEKARQGFRDGLAAATQIAQASFLSQFPEFASIPPEQVPAALEQMSRQDPAKLALVKGMVARTEQLFAQQAQEHQRHAQIARQNFLNFAHTEDARLDTVLKDEPKAIQQAVTAEIMASAKASGIAPAELSRLFHSEPLMRNATFQHMMYDAAKYRLMMKAKDAAVAKSVPPVQRPGMSTARSERDRADLRTLSARLSTSGDIKDAVALYQARRSGKR
jgi:hypothetical protein